jgi:uncharacterized protein YndB with AHSA1/START domain
MATVEMTREYPVARRQLWDHLTEPANWPSFYNNMIDVEASRFAEPGDQVTATYRMLGRNTKGTIALLDIEPGERLRLRAELKGLPPVEFTWVYRDADVGTRIDVQMESVEVDSWLGRTLDRFLVPRQLEKDLGRSMDNIEALVGVDV